MAVLVENSKGFKVVKMKLSECFDAFNVVPTCDCCNKAPYTDNGMGGYYIAVLNSLYCKKCYDGWIGRAKFYPDDVPTETRNFVYVSSKVKIE